MATTERSPFYLTLVSNASTKMYPSNKPQSFKVELSTPISFDGKWEVSLCEYYYPNNMLNIPDETLMKIFLKKDEIEKVDKGRSDFNRLSRSTRDIDAAASNMLRSTEADDEDSETIQPEGNDQNKMEGTEVNESDPIVNSASNRTDRHSELADDAKVNNIEEAEVNRGIDELISFQVSPVYSLINNDISFRVTIPTGKFGSIIDLCTYLNRYLMQSYRKVQTTAGISTEKQHISQPIRFFLDTIEKRVNIVSSYPQTKVQFKSEAYLPFVLGLTTSKTSPISTYELPYIGADEPSLTQNYPAMFLYTNIIEFNMVGDTLAPLLRTVAIKTNEKEDVISKIFNTPYYHELNKNYIKTIEIRICNDAGDDILFQKGKTVLVLHFRPRTLL